MTAKRGKRPAALSLATALPRSLLSPSDTYAQAPCLLKLPDNTWVHYSSRTTSERQGPLISMGNPPQYALPERRSLHPYPDGPFAKCAAEQPCRRPTPCLPEHFQLRLPTRKTPPHKKSEKWRQALEAVTKAWIGPPAVRLLGRDRAADRACENYYRQLREMPFHRTGSGWRTILAYRRTSNNCSRKVRDQFSILRKSIMTPSARTRVWWAADQMAAFGERPRVAGDARPRQNPAGRHHPVLWWHPALGFTTVDYEVSSFAHDKLCCPRRRNERVENSGLGGMDLLYCGVQRRRADGRRDQRVRTIPTCFWRWFRL